MRRPQFFVLLGVASIITIGCRNPMSSSAESRATALRDDESTTDISLVSQSDAKPMVFTDSASLRYGTGKMDADVPTTFTTTPSGLRYRILRRSDGQMPTAADTVKVNYRGWLDNGKEFDSSYDSSPATFPLAGVVKGWTEGMQLVGKGGMIELWVPPSLGYGQQGSPGGVPPNATLHFVVELLDVL